MKKTKITLISTLLLMLFTSVAAAQSLTEAKVIELSEEKWTEMATRYSVPALPEGVAKAPSVAILGSWWHSFEDSTLTELVIMTLESNKDLVSARAKIKEARASLGISKSASLPWLDTTNYWSASKSPLETAGQKIDAYRLGVDASWEIDIFGGRRATVQAGVATLEAQYATLHATWVSLSAEVAINYLSLRTLQERLDVAKTNLSLQQESLEMLSSRYKAGLVDALAYNQAKYLYEQTKATIPPIETSIESVKNSLAVLTGVVPGALEEMLKDKQPIPKADTVELVGIPADALRQRPDIYAAERQLIAQLARTKSARADLWPKFHLVGSIGTEALDTGSLLTGPAKAYSFGPRITWPIFHWGAIKNNIRVQGAREEQYLAAYEKTLLTAVSEVRNALTSEVQERQRNTSLKLGLNAAQEALSVANDKYKSGLTDYNNVLIAQSAYLTLSEQYVISVGELTSNIVRLFKALGGGWEPMK